MSKENSVRPVMASQPVSLNGEGERTAEEMKKDLDGPQQALCKSVFENDIMPEQAFKTDLMPGEEIIAEYDVYLPVKLMQRWLFMLLCISTLGLFYIYWLCQQWCYRRGCCVPKIISMNRGCMAVTSHGRILMWQSEVEQLRTKQSKCMKRLACLFRCCCKEWCAAPVQYTTTTKAGAYRASQVRDIQGALHSQPGICFNQCCCSEAYLSHVQMNFDCYANNEEIGSVVETGTRWDFRNTVKSSFTNGFFGAPSKVQVGSDDEMELEAPVEWDHVVIVGKRYDDSTFDRSHRTYQEAYTDMLKLQREVTKLLHKYTRAAWVAKDSGFYNDEYGQDKEVDNSKKYEFAALDIIGDHDSAAPAEMVVLGEDEKIITSSSKMYIATCMDRIYFVFAVLLYVPWIALYFPDLLIRAILRYYFGMAASWMTPWSYVQWLNHMRCDRTGLVLTTHRIIEIKSARRQACWGLCCPTWFMDMTCCAWFPGCAGRGCINFGVTERLSSIRSIYPGYIRMGMTEFLRSQNALNVYMLGLHGMIKVSFQYGSKQQFKESEKERTKFSKALGQVVDKFKEATIAVKNQPSETEFDQVDKQLLPLCKDEVLLAKYLGEVPEDCCPGCTKEQTWYPGCILCLTCGTKPMMGRESVSVSTHGVYAVKDMGTRPWCRWPIGPCLFVPCPAIENKVAFWAPVADLGGHDVHTTLQGNEYCLSRACFGNYFGDNCCPKLRSTLIISVKAERITLNVNDLSMTKSLRKEPKTEQFRRAVSTAECCLTGSLDCFDMA